MKLITEMTFDTNASVIEESVGGKKNYYIEGIFLQGDIVNGNKRRYPGNILANEAIRFTNENIKTNRAMGELGHPSCFHKNTKALTDTGWKYIQDIREGELVYSLNTESKKIELNPVLKVINEPYIGKMISISNRGISTIVTPNHRFLIEKECGKKLEYITAQEIHDAIQTNKCLHKSILKSSSDFSFNNEIKEFFEITNKYGTLKINSKIFYAFMGIYLSEGYASKVKSGKTEHKTAIYQNVGEKAEIIETILNNMNDLKWNKYIKKNNKGIVWSCTNPILGSYLSTFGNCYEKFIDPSLFKQINQELAGLFLDMFILGDGRGKRLQKYSRCDVFTTSLKLADDLSHMAFIAGVATRSYTQITKKDYMFAGRIIKAENKVPLNMIQILTSKIVSIDRRFLNTAEIDYTGNVYCLQTKNSNFYAQDGGYSFWTGNSGPAINLDRVSHVITELKNVDMGKEKGMVFVGRAKIIDTPFGKIAKSLIDEGVKLGVSSRGMGSIANIGGINEVQKDFRLATIDIVSEPSAPDAFVNGILEGKEFWFDETCNMYKLAEEAKTDLKKMSLKEIQENKVKMFEKFLKNLSSNL